MRVKKNTIFFLCRRKTVKTLEKWANDWLRSTSNRECSEQSEKSRVCQFFAKKSQTTCQWNIWEFLKVDVAWKTNKNGNKIHWIYSPLRKKEDFKDERLHEQEKNKTKAKNKDRREREKKCKIFQHVYKLKLKGR